MTLREALCEILTPAVFADMADRQGLEKEWLVAAALCRIRKQGAITTEADKALITWCQTHGSVWRVEDGDRHLEPMARGQAEETMTEKAMTQKATVEGY